MAQAIWHYSTLDLRIQCVHSGIVVNQSARRQVIQTALNTDDIGSLPRHKISHGVCGKCCRRQVHGARQIVVADAGPLDRLMLIDEIDSGLCRIAIGRRFACYSEGKARCSRSKTRLALTTAGHRQPAGSVSSVLTASMPQAA